MWNRGAPLESNAAEKNRKPHPCKLKLKLIGMEEAGININDVACHFDINKAAAYRTINRSNSILGTFRSYHIKAGEISSSKPALMNV